MLTDKTGFGLTVHERLGAYGRDSLGIEVYDCADVDPLLARLRAAMESDVISKVLEDMRAFGTGVMRISDNGTRAHVPLENLHDPVQQALRMAESALRNCYDVASHPADGSTEQDAALLAVRKALAP